MKADELKSKTPQLGFTTSGPTRLCGGHTGPTRSVLTACMKCELELGLGWRQAKMGAYGGLVWSSWDELDRVFCPLAGAHVWCSYTESLLNAEGVPCDVTSAGLCIYALSSVLCACAMIGHSIVPFTKLAVKRLDSGLFPL
eukprot:1154555-Pelagomonas_calceolata.AAC.3